MCPFVTRSPAAPPDTAPPETASPDTASPALEGLAALRAFYAEQRFAIPSLRADLIARIALGDKVIDHERIHGLRPEPYDMAAVYLVADGLIAEAWFFAA